MQTKKSFARKAFAILLAFVMVLSLVPFSVLADYDYPEGAGYPPAEEPGYDYPPAEEPDYPPEEEPDYDYPPAEDADYDYLPAEEPEAYYFEPFALLEEDEDEDEFDPFLFPGGPVFVDPIVIETGERGVERYGRTVAVNIIGDFFIPDGSPAVPLVGAGDLENWVFDIIPNPAGLTALASIPTAVSAAGGNAPLLAGWRPETTVLTYHSYLAGHDLYGDEWPAAFAATHPDWVEGDPVAPSWSVGYDDFVDEFEDWYDEYFDDWEEWFLGSQTPPFSAPPPEWADFAEGDEALYPGLWIESIRTAEGYDTGVWITIVGTVYHGRIGQQVYLIPLGAYDAPNVHQAHVSDSGGATLSTLTSQPLVIIIGDPVIPTPPVVPPPGTLVAIPEDVDVPGNRTFFEGPIARTFPWGAAPGAAFRIRVDLENDTFGSAVSVANLANWTITNYTNANIAAPATPALPDVQAEPTGLPVTPPTFPSSAATRVVNSDADGEPYLRLVMAQRLDANTVWLTFQPIENRVPTAINDAFPRWFRIHVSDDALTDAESPMQAPVGILPFIPPIEARIQPTVLHGSATPNPAMIAGNAATQRIELGLGPAANLGRNLVRIDFPADSLLPDDFRADARYIHGDEVRPFNPLLDINNWQVAAPGQDGDPSTWTWHNAAGLDEFHQPQSGLEDDARGVANGLILRRADLNPDNTVSLTFEGIVVNELAAGVVDWFYVRATSETILRGDEVPGGYRSLERGHRHTGPARVNIAPNVTDPIVIPDGPYMTLRVIVNPVPTMMFPNRHVTYSIPFGHNPAQFMHVEATLGNYAIFCEDEVRDLENWETGLAYTLLGGIIGNTADIGLQLLEVLLTDYDNVVLLNFGMVENHLAMNYGHVTGSPWAMYTGSDALPDGHRVFIGVFNEALLVPDDDEWVSWADFSDYDGILGTVRPTTAQADTIYIPVDVPEIPVSIYIGTPGEGPCPFSPTTPAELEAGQIRAGRARDATRTPLPGNPNDFLDYGSGRFYQIAFVLDEDSGAWFEPRDIAGMVDRNFRNIDEWRLANADGFPMIDGENSDFPNDSNVPYNSSSTSRGLSLTINEDVQVQWITYQRVIVTISGNALETNVPSYLPGDDVTPPDSVYMVLRALAGSVRVPSTLAGFSATFPHGIMPSNWHSDAATIEVLPMQLVPGPGEPGVEPTYDPCLRVVGVEYPGQDIGLRPFDIGVLCPNCTTEATRPFNLISLEAGNPDNALNARWVNVLLVNDEFAEFDPAVTGTQVSNLAYWNLQYHTNPTLPQPSPAPPLPALPDLQISRSLPGTTTYGLEITAVFLTSATTARLAIAGDAQQLANAVLAITVSSAALYETEDGLLQAPFRVGDDRRPRLWGHFLGVDPLTGLEIPTNNPTQTLRVWVANDSFTIYAQDPANWRVGPTTAAEAHNITRPGASIPRSVGTDLPPDTKIIVGQREAIGNPYWFDYVDIIFPGDTPPAATVSLRPAIVPSGDGLWNIPALVGGSRLEDLGAGPITESDFDIFEPRLPVNWYFNTEWTPQGPPALRAGIVWAPVSRTLPPRITSIDTVTATPVGHPATGGNSTIAITGTALNPAVMLVAAFHGGMGDPLYAVPVTGVGTPVDGRFDAATATIEFPENEHPVLRNYHIRVSLDAGINWVTFEVGEDGFAMVTVLGQEPPEPPTGIEISPTSVIVYQGSTETFTYTLTGGINLIPGATWAVTGPVGGEGVTIDAGVLDVAADATVGEWTVTVTSYGNPNVSASATVTVSAAAEIPVTGVSITEADFELAVGAAKLLTAVIEPLNATNTAVTWATSDAEVATVSATGEVTAVAVGTATITVTTVEGEFYDYVTVTVIEAPIPVTGVTIVEDDFSLVIGADRQLTAVVAPENATNPAVTWSSSDEAVATVSATGEVTAVAVGEATITVTTVEDDFYDTVTVTVTAAVVPVTGVTIAGDAAFSLAVGATRPLTATVAPANATNTAVTWSTSAATVATVSATGLVTAVAAGTATITVTAEGGHTDTVTVTVGFFQFIEGEGWVFYENGVRVTNVFRAGDDGLYRFLGADGFMVTNSVFMATKGDLVDRFFWVDAGGIMQTSTFLSADATGPYTIFGERYFGRDGAMALGWHHWGWVPPEGGDPVFTDYDLAIGGIWPEPYYSNRLAAGYRPTWSLFDENGILVDGWYAVYDDAGVFSHMLLTEAGILVVGEYRYRNGVLYWHQLDSGAAAPVQAP